MIPATQQEALAVLAEVLDLASDIRLGQLFAHLGFLGEDQTGRSLGNIDDEQLLAVLYHHRGELVARRLKEAPPTLPATGTADPIASTSKKGAVDAVCVERQRVPS